MIVKKVMTITKLVSGINYSDENDNGVDYNQNGFRNQL